MFYFFSGHSLKRFKNATIYRLFTIRVPGSKLKYNEIFLVIIKQTLLKFIAPTDCKCFYWCCSDTFYVMTCFARFITKTAITALKLANHFGVIDVIMAQFYNRSMIKTN